MDVERRPTNNGLISTHNKCLIREKPCEVKVSRTVLKTSRLGDEVAQFNEYSGLITHGFSQIPCWWIDCGNDYTHGQVAIGNWYSLELDDYILEPATCTTLPLPTIQYPELLLQADENETLSCAEQALLSGQSININSQMAIAAGEMVHQLLNSQLKRMQVEVDLFRGSMKSTWISQENIDRIVERAKTP